MDELHIERAFAPAFDVRDHRGGRFSIPLAAPGFTVALIFYRGHWCPYCRRYLSKLQQNLTRFRERGVRVAAISPEPVSTSAGLARDLAIDFPLLCDIHGAVIERYGVRNRVSCRRAELPHPAVFVIGATGVVRFKSIDRNYKRRTTVHTILAQVDALLSPAAQRPGALVGTTRACAVE
jgi:peroxiredoxin